MIALLTDFGNNEYIGVMKGVILKENPEVGIVDLCHSILNQSVIEASWVLKTSYHYFPKGTVFCCVVDPQVGTERRAIAVKTEDYVFVAPDNGLLYEALQGQKVVSSRLLPVPEDASRTFHGRDVFAKAAAQIAKGEMPGEEIASVKGLKLHREGDEGMIVRIDRFGNIITNIEPGTKKSYTVRLQTRTIELPYVETYAEGDGLFLVTCSAGTLEIAQKNGSANDELCVKPGQRVTIA